MKKATKESVRRTIEKLRPKFPKGARVAGIDVRDGPDSFGEPAWYVWLLLPDDATDEDIAFDKIDPIRRLIEDELFHSADDPFPHVKLRRVSDHAKATAL